MGVVVRIWGDLGEARASQPGAAFGQRPLGEAGTRRAPSGARALIGLEEFVSLPEWGIFGIEAKVDTGTQTSALHVEALELSARDRLRFVIVLETRPGGRRRRVETRLLRKGWVRPSHGVPRQRLFAETRIVMGSVERSIEIGLVDRTEMRFRMLLGRSAFEHDFWVDASRRHLLGGSP